MSNSFTINLTPDEPIMVCYDEEIGTTYALEGECADEALMPRITAVCHGCYKTDRSTEVEKLDKLIEVAALARQWHVENMEEPEEDYEPDWDTIAKERRMEREVA